MSETSTDTPTCDRCGNICVQTWLRLRDNTITCFGCATDGEWAAVVEGLS